MIGYPFFLEAGTLCKIFIIERASSNFYGISLNFNIWFRYIFQCTDYNLISCVCYLNLEENESSKQQ